MQQLAPPGFPGPDICSTSPIHSAGAASICRVAENSGCPHAVKLNKMTLCMHPESHLFLKNPGNDHSPVRTKTIMIVDHDLQLMHQMAGILRNAGYEVMESDDGNLSLQVLEEWNHIHIDLVITDTKMQGILRQTFLDLRPNTHILVVSEQPPSRLDLPAVLPLLAKPFTSVTLLKKVIGLIGKQD